MSSPENEAHTARFGVWLLLIGAVLSIFSVLHWVSGRTVVPRDTSTWQCPAGHVLMHAGGAHAPGYVCLAGVKAQWQPEPPR